MQFVLSNMQQNSNRPVGFSSRGLGKCWMTNCDLVARIRVSPRTPARWRSRCLLGRIVPPRDGRNRRPQGPSQRWGEGEPQAGSDRRKREPHRPGPSCCPTGKLSRGNVKTTKSCHNGNYLGGSRNPHEMSGLGVIAPEASGLTGSYCECLGTPLQVIWC